MRWAAVLSLSALVLAGCSNGGDDSPSKGGEEPPETSPESIWFHRAGGGPADAADFAGEPPVFRLETFPGVWGWEPMLGIDPDGTIFYAASTNVSLDGSPQGGSHEILVLRGRDRGSTWTTHLPTRLAGDVTVQNPGANDPYLAVDRATGRVYAGKARAECTTLAWSDDAGDSWILNPAACGNPFEDRPILFTGPTSLPASPPGFPRVAYLCSNQVVTSTCKHSLDGGLTFQQGRPPFADDDTCLGGSGHQTNGAVSELTGTAFIARPSACNDVQVARSTDLGLTWSLAYVSEDAPGDGCQRDTVLAVDGSGTVHLAWLDAACLPRLASSDDDGVSWTPGRAVGRPGLVQASHLGIAAGAAGKVAVSYLGTEQNASEGAGRSWSLHVATTLDAAATDPVFVTVDAGGRPLVAGLDAGGAQALQGLHGVGDFLGLAAAPDGWLAAAAVDVCQGPCTSPDGEAPLGRAAIAIQVGGVTLA